MEAVKKYQLFGVSNSGDLLNITCEPNGTADLFGSEEKAVNYAKKHAADFFTSRFVVLPVFLLTDKVPAAKPDKTEKEKATPPPPPEE